MMRTVPCRACGSMIGFIKTVAGKTMPVDEKSMYVVPSKEGTPFVLADGSVISGLAASKDEPGAVIGYISHFATCPEADKFRKPRKSDRKKG